MPKLRPTAARGKGVNCEGATRAVAMDRTRSARLRLPLSLGAFWVLDQPNEVEGDSVFLGRGARSVDDATFPLPRLLSLRLPKEALSHAVTRRWVASPVDARELDVSLEIDGQRPADSLFLSAPSNSAAACGAQVSRPLHMLARLE